MDLAGIEARLGPDRFANRIRRQHSKSAILAHQGEGIFRWERLVPFDRAVKMGLAALGLRRRGLRNFLDVRVVEQEWRLPRLPSAFEGFRLLHLTDLHIDLEPALTPLLARVATSTPHDAAVLTGDYRNKTTGDHAPCLREMAALLPSLSAQRWGILGNHDFLEMVPELESAGLPILLNEVACIERSGQQIFFAGVDDPHFYRTHDLRKVRAAIPRDACGILLAHSPETYKEAADLGFDLQLSGHTHGGQICLPGGKPLVLPLKIDPAFINGPWQFGALPGYTSPGTGGCSVPARFNCPPEITLHILRGAR